MRDNRGAQLALPADLARDIVQVVSDRVHGVDEGQSPVLLTSTALRPLVRELLVDALPQLPVLSYSELAPEFTLRKAPPITP